MARPSWARSFFIGYQRDSYTPGFKQPFIACRGRCMNHRRQAALHVRRATAEQICAFDTWLELIAALRRNNIVVTAEIKRSPPGSGRREYTAAFTSHLVEAELFQFVHES